MPRKFITPTAEDCYNILRPFFERYPNPLMETLAYAYAFRLLAKAPMMSGLLVENMAALILVVDSVTRLPGMNHKLNHKDIETAFNVDSEIIGKRYMGLRYILES